MKLRWIVLVMVCVLSARVWAQHEHGHPEQQGVARIQYAVDLQNARTQTIDVSITVFGLDTDVKHLDFVLPSWRPGRYVILDFAGGVSGVSAISGCEEKLPVTKLDKATWRVPTNAHDTVILSYRVYCNTLADRTRHADDTHAFLSGSAVFMYVDGRREEPVQVKLKMPENSGWKAATGLAPVEGYEHTFYAPTFDVLVDSPIEAGVHEVMTFEVDGTPHEIVVWGRGAFDREQMPKDFATIIAQQKKIFGDLPYSRYVFLVHSYPGGSGGTEHLNSTVVQVSPERFESADGYRRFLRLISHETFHTWNVKQFRPAGIHPYDYTRENYTDLLWLVEGSTSYYDALTLVRAGITNPDDYLRDLATGITTLKARPGADRQSLAESSFDAWTKHWRPTPDSVNTTVSFYDKGALVSLLLDLAIRSHTENRASLDDVMRRLYREFPLNGPGYTAADVQRIVDEAAGTSMQPFFEAYINGLTEPDFVSALAHAGLELTPNTSSADAAYIGLTLRDEGGLAVVSAALADGPAHAAGIIPGDQIVALDGLRLRSGELENRLKAFKPGQTATIQLLRRDELKTYQLTLASRPSAVWKLARVSSPTAAQLATYEAWLGQPWPAGSSAASATAADAEAAVSAVLDGFHDAAARADGERYFGLFAPEGVFLGTDATERWTVEEFKAYAEPHFSKGRGWTYTSRARQIDISDCGKVAWFDELLDNAKLGECRGSGVLVQLDGAWKVAQYHLTIPVPNELAEPVVKQIREKAASGQ